MFDQVREDHLRVVGIDPDTAGHFTRLAARVGLEVGDDFAASGSARGPRTAAGTATVRSPPTFSSSRSLTAPVLAFVSG